ncbi:MAG: hypothetical protein EA399_07025 [Desulfovibrionales bacterium]|nr:MAG: hypothetical protein EA399_07025 [Desulfovibrionales bacterium]
MKMCKLIFTAVALLAWCTLEWVVPMTGHAQCAGVFGRACVRIEGSNAFLANTDQGLTIVNMNDPRNPEVLGCLQTKGCIIDMDFSEGFAYVVDDKEGLLIVDVSNPERCVAVGRYHTYGGDIQSFNVFGTYALASISGRGLRVFDISSPEKPRKVAMLDRPEKVQGMAIVADHAYVANFNGGLHIIDLRQPEQPMEVSVMDIPGRPRGLGVSESRLFMNTSERKMHLIDIQSPTDPQISATIDIGGSPVAVVAGNRAYVASLDRGFMVFDISNPEQVELIGRTDLEGICLAMCIHDPLAYLSIVGLDEVHVIDLQQIVQN